MLAALHYAIIDNGWTIGARYQFMFITSHRPLVDQHVGQFTADTSYTRNRKSTEPFKDFLVDVIIKCTDNLRSYCVVIKKIIMENRSNRYISIGI